MKTNNFYDSLAHTKIKEDFIDVVCQYFPVLLKEQDKIIVQMDIQFLNIIKGYFDINVLQIYGNIDYILKKISLFISEAFYYDFFSLYFII